MKHALLFLLLLSSRFSFAQNQDNNWVFGHHAGLDFNFIVPQPFTSTIYSVEDCASISDSGGVLQFFTNGVNVYNRLGQMMPNGDSLATGYQSDYGANAPQSVVILPVPGNSAQYYLFTRSDTRLTYSIIDMTLDVFNGDVSVKNQVLYSNPVQKFMTAVKHGNGIDWWLIAHGLGEKWFVWRLTSAGIDTLVNNSIGLAYDSVGLNSYTELVSNLQGTKLAFGSAQGLQLVDFDRCHGTLSNFDTVPLPKMPYSFAFSPHGTMLYFTFHQPLGPTDLWQTCINCNGGPDSNINKIYHDDNLLYNLGQLQNGPDSKIYAAMSYWSPTDTNTSIYNTNLSVINEPDQLGTNCDFDTATVSLGGNYSIIGLPNSPYYNMPASFPACGDTLATSVQTPNESKADIYPNPAGDFLFINIPGTQNRGYAYDIYDAQGRRIIGREKNLSSDRKINVALLPHGLYFILIHDEQDLVLKETFVKQ